MLLRTTALASLLLLSACSTLEFPGAYVLSVDQGNIITHKMLEQLKPGMSKSQVEYVMGSPLIKDSFASDRWDYVYKKREGRKILDERRVTVYFNRAGTVERYVSKMPRKQPAEDAAG